MEAKKALQEFGKRADLDAVAKTKSTPLRRSLKNWQQVPN